MLNTKRFAKFSSILITTFLFAFSFANFAYANPTFTVNTATVGQIDFIGSNLDGISEIYVYLTKKSSGTTQRSGSVPVVSNSFSHSFYGKRRNKTQFGLVERSFGSRKCLVGKTTEAKLAVVEKHITCRFRFNQVAVDLPPSQFTAISNLRIIS